MSDRLRSFRRRMIAKTLGVDLAGEVLGLRDTLARLESQHAEMERRGERIERVQELQMGAARRTMDDVETAKSRLAEFRESPEYAAAMASHEPLVSVRIATYERTEQLMDVAIASVLDQTYERWELVIVNDGPNERTRRAVESLRDRRIRYSELPERGQYPDGQRSRWLVAGTDPANMATELAEGEWVAHLDDDDRFSADHIEKLLGVAWDNEAELAYGALEQANRITGDTRIIWSDPPQVNEFSFQGSIYLTGLRFLGYEPWAWILDEPADWNLIRRMKLAGVRMAATADTVGYIDMVPYTHK